MYGCFSVLNNSWACIIYDWQSCKKIEKRPHIWYEARCDHYLSPVESARNTRCGRGDGADDVPPEVRHGGVPSGDCGGAGGRVRGGFARIGPPGGVGEEPGDARGRGLFHLQPHDAALRRGQPLGVTAGHFSFFVQEGAVRREGLAAGVCQSEVVFEGTGADFDGDSGKASSCASTCSYNILATIVSTILIEWTRCARATVLMRVGSLVDHPAVKINNRANPKLQACRIVR